MLLLPLVVLAAFLAAIRLFDRPSIEVDRVTFLGGWREDLSGLSYPAAALIATPSTIELRPSNMYRRRTRLEPLAAIRGEVVLRRQRGLSGPRLVIEGPSRTVVFGPLHGTLLMQELARLGWDLDR